MPLFALLFLFIAFTLGPTLGRDWPVYHGDHAATHYSPLAQIHRGNVAELQPTWIFETDRSGTLQCNPLVIGRTVYLVDQDLRLHAVDGRHGNALWRFDPPERLRGVCRGVTFWQSADRTERRLFYVAGSYLYAIDPNHGRSISSFGVEGRIDLREQLDTEETKHSVTCNTPGIVFRDLIIMGSRVGEGPQQAAPGHVRAFDVRTGKRRWIFHTIPHPGEFGYETWPPDAWKTVGGANSWGGLTLDVDRGMVFFGTGSPSYDHYGGNRVGTNLFGNCVMALQAETGAYVWHYQVVHHDLWDYDIPCQPNLVTVTHDGKTIDAVAQSTKMGHLFLLDRETGRPLFPVEERPVPPSTIPGEASWPTQPFPTKPPPYAVQQFTEDDITQRTPEATASVRAFIQSKDLLLGDLFLPPGIQPSVVMPQFNGGGEWGGAGYNPETGWLFVNASNEPEWQSMVPAKPQGATTQGALGKQLYHAICAQCHGNKAARPEGSPPLPALETVRDRLTPPQVSEILEKGRGQMPSFTSLSAAERSAIVAYLFGEGTDERVPSEALTSNWYETIPYVCTGHHDFRDPDGFPVNQPPWGTLTAINLHEGSLAWQIPLGTYPALEEQGSPPTGTFTIGGPLVTAGGLVFIGATMDERFHAYDQSNGELLWEFQMEAGGYASPSTYAIDGRQYILIAAGGAGKPGTKAGNRYYCFALPKG